MKHNIISIILSEIRLPLIILTLVYSISILGLTLIPNNNTTEGLSFFEAFYVTTYTATTIGFGELPNEFSEPQRFWMLLVIYTSVISWLFTIGKIVQVMKNPAIAANIKEKKFQQRVNHLTNDFWIVCGYGKAGTGVVEIMRKHGTSTIVIDPDQNKIHDFFLKEYDSENLFLTGRADEIKTLKLAGIDKPNCKGIIIVTNDDEINLKISIFSKVIAPSITTITKTTNQETEDNIRSFKGNYIINSHKIFSETLLEMYLSPSKGSVHSWLTSELFGRGEPTKVPKGPWILCGLGDFGISVDKTLRKITNQIYYIGNIIDEQITWDDIDDRFSWASGVEEKHLIEADIQNSRGIIAGTNSDIDNLSIIMTAKNLNKNIFTIARINDHENKELFDKINCDVIYEPFESLIRHIYQKISVPLVGKFINETKHLDESWHNEMLARYYAIANDDEDIETWDYTINAKSAYGPFLHIKMGEKITLEHICSTFENRGLGFNTIPLMIVRNNTYIISPEYDLNINAGDTILFIGISSARDSMKWTMHNPNVMYYRIYGKEPAPKILSKITQ